MHEYYYVVAYFRYLYDLINCSQIYSFNLISFVDHLHSSNPQLNNCEFPEHSTERVHTPQTDSKSRTDMDSLKVSLYLMFV